MRFTIDGMLAVARKDDPHRGDPNITTYVVSLFENKIERDTYYVTMIDVTSQKEAIDLLTKEVTRQRERYARRSENTDKLTTLDEVLKELS